MEKTEKMNNYQALLAELGSWLERGALKLVIRESSQRRI